MIVSLSATIASMPTIVNVIAKKVCISGWL